MVGEVLLDPTYALQVSSWCVPRCASRLLPWLVLLEYVMADLLPRTSPRCSLALRSNRLGVHAYTLAVLPDRAQTCPAQVQRILSRRNDGGE